MKDLKKIQSEENDESITAVPEDDNILKWSAIIFGPDDTEWEGGVFKLKMVFSDQYPNKPPEVQFLTKIFHPNVYNDGRICLDILQNNWSPVYDVQSILISVQQLLTDPNNKSPANNEASQMHQNNYKEYVRRVKECVQKSQDDMSDDDDEDEDKEKDNGNDNQIQEQEQTTEVQGEG